MQTFKGISRLGERVSLPRPVIRRCLSSTQEEWNSDITIVGGGVVGTALACKIADTPSLSHLKVSLVENRAPPPLSKAIDTNQKPDVRTYAMTAKSEELLSDLGVWAPLRESGRLKEYDTMQVWEWGGHGYITFDVNNHGQLGDTHLGTIVEHTALQASLYERVSELHDQGRVALHCPATVTKVDMGRARADVNRPADPIKVEIKQGEEQVTLSTRLLVAADGANSPSRRAAGISTWGWGYGQKAVIVTVELEKPTSVAWQVPSNRSVAVLPLFGNYANIVWSIDSRLADELTQLTEEEFMQRLNESLHEDPTSTPSPITTPFPNPFRKFEEIIHSAARAAEATGDKPFAFPPKVTKLSSGRFGIELAMQQAHQYAAPRFVLVGDAAHRIHPMAGQGLNMGLGDVVELAKVLETGVQDGRDIGDLNLLNEYDRDRKVANLKMISLLQGLHHTFGATPEPLRWARNAGLAALNAFPPVKSQIVKFAKGEL